MARTKKTPFAPWESTKSDGIEQRYIRYGNSQLLHEAVLNLSHSAFRVYTYMRLESGGRIEFEFPRTKFIKIVSRDGFQRAVKELVEAGFIDVTEQNANLRKANKYRFSSRWKDVK